MQYMVNRSILNRSPLTHILTRCEERFLLPRPSPILSTLAYYFYSVIHCLSFFRRFRHRASNLSSVEIYPSPRTRAYLEILAKYLTPTVAADLYTDWTNLRTLITHVQDNFPLIFRANSEDCLATRGPFSLMMTDHNTVILSRSFFPCGFDYAQLPTSIVYAGLCLQYYRDANASPQGPSTPARITANLCDLLDVIIMCFTDFDEDDFPFTYERTIFPDSSYESTLKREFYAPHLFHSIYNLYGLTYGHQLDAADPLASMISFKLDIEPALTMDYTIVFRTAITIDPTFNIETYLALLRATPLIASFVIPDPATATEQEKHDLAWCFHSQPFRRCQGHTLPLTTNEFSTVIIHFPIQFNRFIPPGKEYPFLQIQMISLINFPTMSIPLDYCSGGYLNFTTLTLSPRHFDDFGNVAFPNDYREVMTTAISGLLPINFANDAVQGPEECACPDAANNTVEPLRHLGLLTRTSQDQGQFQT